MLAPGEVIDIWVVEKALGSGGMGSVYRCHNRRATRILAAVKVLDAAVGRAKGAEERFIREAEILFRVDHPNVVKVRNIRTDTQPPYLEMEFVEGESLESILQRGPLPMPRAVALFGQLVDAVAYLHGLGIRHRDIKPQNLLVRPDGTLKLVDFGLAMEADASRITQQGTTFGTVSYAPPEWANETLDPVLWDMYAIGVVFWEMLTGDVAFPVSGQGSARQQAMQVMLAKQHHAPLDPGELFPEPLRALIADLTASDPARRARDAAAIHERLRTFDPQLPIARRATSGPPRPQADTWTDNSGKVRVPELALAVEAANATPTPPRLLPSQTLSMEPPTSAPPAAPSQPATRRARWPWLVAAAGAAAVVALATSGVALIAVFAWPAGTPDPRPVDVVVGGLADGTAVTVTLDGVAASSRDAWVFHFPPTAIGAHQVRATVGDGCEPCLRGDASCPAWCDLVPAKAVEVGAGDGPQMVPLAITPRPARPVTVRVQGADRASLEVSGTDVALDGAHQGTIALAPGKYPYKLATCPDDCPEAGCPAGCAEDFGELVVPASGDAALAITAPAAWASPSALPTPAVTPRPTPRPTPAPTPSAARGGRLVTNAEFARWLSGHADWTRDAAVAAGRAEAPAYLEGWTDTNPPAGRDGSPAVSVSWYAAQAFCSARGGLADVTSEPQRWDEVSTVYYEWRQTSDGAPMFRAADGTTGVQRSKKANNVMTGFRCAR